jgi:hypothetical protein
LSTEGKINTAIELLPQLKINYDLLTRDSQKIYEEVMNKSSAATLEL